MNSLKNLALLKEFEAYLTTKGYYFEKEMFFKFLMPIDRNYRADYYLITRKTFIEINGGQWIKGRHNRGGKGYEDDLNKINISQAYGFKYYQFTYEMLARLEYKSFF